MRSFNLALWPNNLYMQVTPQQLLLQRLDCCQDITYAMKTHTKVSWQDHLLVCNLGSQPLLIFQSSRKEEVMLA